MEAEIKDPQCTDFLFTKMDAIHLERRVIEVENKLIERIADVRKEVSNLLKNQIERFVKYKK